MPSSGSAPRPHGSLSIGSQPHLLCAGLLVDAESLEFLSDITIGEIPESGIVLSVLAERAQEFLSAVAPALGTRPGIERALALYLEQQLATYGLHNSEIVISVLVPN